MNDNSVGVLLEDVQDKLQRLAESISNVHHDIQYLKTTTAKIPELADDVRVIKAAVTDQSRQYNEIDRRVANLETIAS